MINRNSLVIIVEDDELYRFYLNYNLENKYGCRIIDFSNGISFLNFIKTNSINNYTLILDYQLPDLKPEEILQFVKSKSNKSRVIIHSSNNKISDAIRLIKMGAKDYVLKCKSLNILFEKLEKSFTI